jgi:hypothetical protein
MTLTRTNSMFALLLATLTACSGDAVPSTEPRGAWSSVADGVSAPSIASATPLYLAVGSTRQLRSESSARGRRMQRTSWNSTGPLVASVTSDGLVSGRAEGAAWIVGTTLGRADSTRFLIISSTPPSIAPASVELSVGDSVRLSASAVPVSWTSSNSSVATVTTDGRVVALSSGTAQITAATPIGTTGTSTVSVRQTVTPPNVGPSNIAELPRVLLDAMVAEARASSTGRTIPVASQSALQRAIDTARLGDQILLQPGLTYTGTTTLKKKAGGSGWITIRSSSALPAAGTRISPQSAGLLARLVAANAALPVIVTEPGAHHYLFQGVEVTANAGAIVAYSLIAIGDGPTTQSTILSQPSQIVFDRVYVHGTPTLNFQRCIALNGAYAAVVDSWISECHSKGFDSQAIFAFNGSGPLKIENNYLEGAGENIMLGGADPANVAMIPSDVEIRRNHFFKPPTWQGVWTVKNLLELKLGKRVLIEDNVLENCWVDAQIGFAVVLKSVNQDGSASFSETSDVTFRFNIVSNSSAGINAAGRPEQFSAIPMKRVSISQNIFRRIGNGDFPGGRLWYVAGVDSISFENNSGVGGSGLMMEGTKVNFLSLRNNLFASDSDRRLAILSASGAGFGTSALSAHASRWIAEGNVILGVMSPEYPSGNNYPSTVIAAGLTGWPISIGLAPTSPLLQAGVGGSTPGANVALVESRTAGVTAR